MAKSGTKYSEKDASDMKRILYRQLCDHSFSATAIAKKLKTAYGVALAADDAKTMLKILAEVRAWYKFLAKSTDDESLFCPSSDSSAGYSNPSDSRPNLTPEELDSLRIEYVGE